MLTRGPADNFPSILGHALPLKPWKADTTGDIDSWLVESRDLAESVAYDPIILRAVSGAGELRPIVLPESYMQHAGELARQRIVTAGLRLATLLQ